jgi:hypothetical protein
VTIRRHLELPIAEARIFATLSPVRFLLAFIVSLSFLAGQTCGQGVAVFYPLQLIEGELMSRAVAQCIAQQDASVDQSESADCGVGKCVSQGKQEPESAATVHIHDDIIMKAAHVSEQPNPLQIAYNENVSDESSGGRPPTMVRRE